MNLSLIRSMTRSAVFELENGLCFRPAHPFVVTLNGKTVYEACNTNVFSLFSLLPGTEYTVGVQAEGETLSLTFVTEAETFFVDASRYGLVADGETDNTGKLQAALSTCPKGGTVYVPAGRYRTASLFLKSNTTLYLEKGAVLLGDNDRTHYPILPGVLPSENEVDEYYLTGWEGNPLSSFAGLLNITQVHDVVVTGEGTLDCDAQNGDWWINPKVKRIAWRPRAVAMVDSDNICLHGITVQNSYSWTIHPIFVKHLDLLNFNINNPYNAPNTDGIDPESCEDTRIIGVNIHVGDDCIAMKASKVFLGMKLKRSCEHTVIRHLEKGRVVIFGCGIGCPFFSTDTAAVLRAAEIEADVILLAKNIDGVYDSDPAKNADAVKFDTITYDEVLKRHLAVMDSTATSLSMDNHIPVLVFALKDPENIIRALRGEKIGTIVKED